MGYLKFFFEAIFPQIQHPFVLVTSNGHGAIDEKYRPYIEHEKIGKWFARNATIEHPKICCIPLGVPWYSTATHALVNTYFSSLKRDNYFAEKFIYCYLNIRCTHPARAKALELFKTKPFCMISKFCPFERYIAHVESSRFVISPRGFNIDCFRTWEALYAGSIPVIESRGIDRVYDGLPVIIVDDYEQVTQEFLDAEFAKLQTKTFDLQKLHAEYWFNLIREAQEML